VMKRTLILIISLLVLGFMCLTACSNDVEGDVAEKDNKEDADEKAEEKEYSAPDFTVYTTDGEAVTLHESFGKPLVVNFWATWCPPCKAEMPDFDELYKEYGDRVDFMMVNLTDGNRDTVAAVKDFIAEKGYSFPVYCDSDMTASYFYGVQSIPTTVFFDADGNIITTNVGMMSREALSEMLRKMTEE